MTRIVPITDRTAERMAIVLGVSKNATLTDEQKAAVQRAATAAKPIARKDLGPNQLAWCRAEIHGFATMEAQVKASDARRAEMAAAVQR